jgi:hypothetical protein
MLELPSTKPRTEKLWQALTQTPHIGKLLTVDIDSQTLSYNEEMSMYSCHRFALLLFWLLCLAAYNHPAYSQSVSNVLRASQPKVAEIRLREQVEIVKRQVGGAVVGGAANTIATSATPTLVVSTITLANGAISTTQIAFSQTFVAGATQGAAVPAGVIGLPTGSAATASANASSRHVHATSWAFIVLPLVMLVAAMTGTWI